MDNTFQINRFPLPRFYTFSQVVAAQNLQDNASIKLLGLREADRWTDRETDKFRWRERNRAREKMSQRDRDNKRETQG